MIDTKGYVSVAEAAERLHLSAEQVRRRLRCGKLKGQRIGSQWFVRFEQLDKGSDPKRLIPPEVIAEVKRIRKEIAERNRGRDFDVLELLRETRESH